MAGRARFFSAQGNYAKAEPLSRQALATAEKVFGPEHPGVAGALDQLGVIYLAKIRSPNDFSSER